MVPVVQLSIPMVPPDVWAHYAGVPPPKPPFPPTPPPVLAPTPPPLQEVPAPPRVIAPRVILPLQRHPAAAAVPPPRVIPPPATPIIPRQAAPPAPRILLRPQRHPAAAPVPPPRVLIPRQAAPPAQADPDRRVHGRRDPEVAAVDSAADSPYDMDRDADAFGEDAADDDEFEEHADDDELKRHAEDMLHRLTTPLDVQRAQGRIVVTDDFKDTTYNINDIAPTPARPTPVRFLDAYNSDEFAQRQQRPPKKRSLTPQRWQEDDEDGDDPPDAGYPPQQLFQDPDHPLSTVWKRQKRNTIAAAISCQCYPAGAAPPSVPRPPSEPPPAASARIICTRRFADDAVPHRAFGGAAEVETVEDSPVQVDRLDQAWKIQHRHGAIYTKDPHALQMLLHRLRKNNHAWEFPKGRRLSKTESVVRTAIREFREETGIQAPYIPSELGYRTPPDTRTRRWWSGSGYTWKRT